MSEQITVTLPDGSTAQVAPGTTPPRSPRDRAAAWQRPRSPRRPTASGSTSIARSTTTSRCAIIVPDSDDGREVLRHSTAHVLAEAVTRLFPGAKYAIGPAIADGFYYDFELPGGETFSEDDLAQIEHEMRDDREARPAVRARGALATTTRCRCSPTSRTSARSSRRCAPATRRARTRARPVTTARACRVYRNVVDGDTCFIDLCRGPHVPSTEAARRVQAHEGRGRVLARQREGPDAAAHLRHRVGVEGGARRAPAPPRGSRAPRPPQARSSSSTCSRSPRRSAPASRCSTRRVRSCGASWRSTRASGTRRRGYEFVNSPHITQGGPVRDLGPPRLVRRRHVPAHAPRRGRAGRRGHHLLPEADELPVPRPDLQAPHTVVPRAAAAVLRVRLRCTATRSRAWCTASRACAA